MGTGWERWLVGTLAAGIVAAGGVWVLRPVEPVAPAAKTPTAVAQAARPAAAAPLRPAQVVPSSLLDAKAPPLGRQVERLLASGDPQQAYTAYLLVSVCAQFNDRHDFAMYDEAQRSNRALEADERQQISGMCGSITERERQARFDYLASAVKAGVPGAAWAYAVEGPFGDPSALKTRPDDPLVKEWKATATTQLTRDAEAGDLATLHIWGVQNLVGSDLAAKQPELGYGYLLATGFIEADRLGPNTPGAQSYADGSALMNAMAAAGGLTPQQRAAAIAAARRIADKVKAGHQQGGAAPY